MDADVALAGIDGPTLLMFYRAVQLIQSGRVQDQEEAAALIREVAERSGTAAPQHELGNLYMFGTGGVPKSSVLAVLWFTKAATQGLVEAQYTLGKCYEIGQGVVINTATAAEWYSKGAEQDHGPSQRQLGMLYKRGLGVPQNYTLAVQWLTKAANNGDAYAQHNLAGCFWTGQGVAQNLAAAAEVYKAAADQGGGVGRCKLNPVLKVR